MPKTTQRDRGRAMARKSRRKKRMRNLTYLKIIVLSILCAVTFTMVYKNHQQLDIIRNNFRTWGSSPAPYRPADIASDLKPDTWNIIYMPDGMPVLYDIYDSSSSDEVVFLAFTRYLDDFGDPIFDGKYPNLYFSQWNSKQEFVYATGWMLPKSLYNNIGSGRNHAQTSESQLELRKNADVEVVFFDNNRFYITSDTYNGDMVILWYMDEYTFTLRMENGIGQNVEFLKEFSIEDLIKIINALNAY